MIARDEEQWLVQSLASVSALVDEVVLVDTGSTDRTQEIAAAFGARVYTMQWTGDFSEARNVALERAQGAYP